MYMTYMIIIYNIELLSMCMSVCMYTSIYTDAFSLIPQTPTNFRL